MNFVAPSDGNSTGVTRYTLPLLKFDSSFWLVLALSIFAWGPLLTPAYFFNAHDAKHSVFFLVEFDQTFRDGYLWPRWSPDFAFGYGYPLFNLYAPLSFYAAQIFVLMGFGFTTAIKTMYILGTIGAGLGMYGFVRRLYGPSAGLLAAVVYMYAPFHLVEIYVRSAYAEFIALAIIPFLFWAFTELIAVPSPRRLALAGFAYGLLALTHHTSFFTFSPILIIYILYLIVAKTYKRYQSPSSTNHQSLISQTLYAAGAGILGLALAGIYLIPLLTEIRFVKVEQWTSGSYNYLQHFVYFSQFFSPEWGYGYAGVGLLDNFSFQIGIVMICLFAVALISSLAHHFPHRNTALFFIFITFAAILLMSPASESLWRILPIASLVQFPWRLLAVTTFSMAIVSGAFVYQLPVTNHQLPTPKLYVLALVIILASFSYTIPQYTEIPDWAETPLAVINWDRDSIVDRVGMIVVTQEQPQTSPLESQYLNNEPLTTAGIIAGHGAIEVLHHGGGSDEVRVVAAEPVTVQFYTYDYPGWQVSLDGQLLAHHNEAPFGLITVDVPAGEHTLRLQMGNTFPRILGTVMSGLALLTIIGFYFSSRYQRPKIDNS